MLDYIRFKQDFFKAKIKARKKELGYLTPAKNKSSNICGKCRYMEAFSPYMNRCCLISFDDARIASVNLEGVCNEFMTGNVSRSIPLMEKYNNIEYDELDKREAIEAHREASKKL